MFQDIVVLNILLLIHKKEWSEDFKEYFYGDPICETYEQEDAQLICKLLNEANNETSN